LLAVVSVAELVQESLAKGLDRGHRSLLCHRFDAARGTNGAIRGVLFVITSQAPTAAVLRRVTETGIVCRFVDAVSTAGVWAG
jgi:hypothetical protein